MLAPAIPDERVDQPWQKRRPKDRVLLRQGVRNRNDFHRVTHEHSGGSLFNKSVCNCFPATAGSEHASQESVSLQPSSSRRRGTDNGWKGGWETIVSVVSSDLFDEVDFPAHVGAVGRHGNLPAGSSARRFKFTDAELETLQCLSHEKWIHDLSQDPLDAGVPQFNFGCLRPCWIAVDDRADRPANTNLRKQRSRAAYRDYRCIDVDATLEAVRCVG